MANWTRKKKAKMLLQDKNCDNCFWRVDTSFKDYRLIGDCYNDNVFSLPKIPTCAHWKTLRGSPHEVWRPVSRGWGRI